MNLLRRLLPGIALVMGAFLLSIGLQAIAAWTPPGGSPPSSNAYAPLNTGSDWQSKAAGLNINASGATAYGLIVQSGNVGIGTASPGNKLSVNGTAVFGGSSGTSGEPIEVQGGLSGVAHKDRDGVSTRWVQYVSGGLMRFYNDATGDRMVITTAGNVGIGTASPGSKLYVQGGQIKVNEAESGAGELRVGAAWGYPGIYGESASKPLVLGSATGNIFMNGSVGIGTASPGSKFQVFGGRTEIGTTGADYSPVGGTWNYNLLLDAADTSSIGFHDAGASVSSIRYNSSGFTIGGDDGWGIRDVYMPGYVRSNTGFCIGASCITSWPGGGGGGGSGTVTSVATDNGLTGGTITTSGTLGLNITGISSCTNSTTNKIYWNGSQLVCGTDQTSGGGGGGVSGSGSTNYISKWTGASSLGNSQIYDNGSIVGVGFSGPIPNEKFNVSGNIYISSNWYKAGNYNAVNTAVALWGAEGGVITGFANGKSVAMGQTTTGYAGIGISAGVTTLGSFYYDHLMQNVAVESYSGAGVMINANGANRMYIAPNGTVYAYGYFWVGNSTIYTQDVWLANAGRWATSYSDLRLKKNIEPLTNTLDKVLNLRGVSFNWNDSYAALGHSNDKRQIGVVAQELETQFPELVTASSTDGYKTVNYEGLTAVLLEAVKEQQKEIDVLKAEIEALKKR